MGRGLRLGLALESYSWTELVEGCKLARVVGKDEWHALYLYLGAITHPRAQCQYLAYRSR